MRKTAAALAILMGCLGLSGQLGLAATGDVVFERKGGKSADAFPPTVFPHWVHRIRYRCYVCHPVLFEMKAGANAVTMDSIKAGQHCGACHDGKRAFIVEFQTCAKCHKPPEE